MDKQTMREEKKDDKIQRKKQEEWMKITKTVKNQNDTKENYGYESQTPMGWKYYLSDKIINACIVKKKKYQEKKWHNDCVWISINMEHIFRW